MTGKHEARATGVIAVLFALWGLGSLFFAAASLVLLWGSDRPMLALIWMIALLGDALLLAAFSIANDMRRMNEGG